MLCTCEVVVLLIKPIVFLTFSLPSASLDLKVPTLDPRRTLHSQLPLAVYLCPSLSFSRRYVSIFCKITFTPYKHIGIKENPEIYNGPVLFKTILMLYLIKLQVCLWLSMARMEKASNLRTLSSCDAKNDQKPILLCFLFDSESFGIIFLVEFHIIFIRKNDSGHFAQSTLS